MSLHSPTAPHSQQSASLTEWRLGRSIPTRRYNGTQEREEWYGVGYEDLKALIEMYVPRDEDAEVLEVGCGECSPRSRNKSCSSLLEEARNRGA